MKTKLLLLASLMGSIAMAADYTLDFSGATLQEAEAPVLRRAEMAVAVGSVPAVAVGDMLHLKLFGDVDFALRIVSAPPAGIAGQSLIARDENGSASAIVKVSKGSARISVDDFVNRRQYTVRCKDGKALIVERDNSQEDGGECGTCGGEIEVPQPAVEETKTTSTKKSRKLLGASGNEFPLAEQKSVVDILVAFDQGAITRARWFLDYEEVECDDEIPMVEFAGWAVDKMNTVLKNSQVDDKFYYRLVGVTKIDDKWTTIDNALLESVRSRSGKFAKLAQLREKYGADTITLLINRSSGNTSGIGYEYNSAYATPDSFDEKNCACNVCDINTVYSRYTMSHETGHNMGCGHSNRQGSNSGPGRYSYSCGYHFTDANNVRRSTVMAYTYTSDDNEYYNPVPYFSTPDISPTEYGCALGVESVNNNRSTLLQTHADTASLREHVMPYDWDVKFLDDNNEDIPDGSYFSSYYYVTMSHENPNAQIYYTYDGSTPTQNSDHCDVGTRFTMSGSKTITACAVVNGEAQSVRTIKFNEGLEWSGDSNGDGLWLSGDSSVKPWSGEYFYNGDNVRFPDLAESNEATVTVKGSVAPGSTEFAASETKYIFDQGDDEAKIILNDTTFAPVGSLTFNVPVQMAATSFTSPANKVVEFNALFGTDPTGTEATYNPTTPIVVGSASTLKVAPGNGKTQTFVNFNNTGTYWSTSKFIVGEGTVRFTGTNNGGKGLFGSLQLEVQNGGNLVFETGDVTGYSVNNSSLTIGQGGTVTFNTRDSLRRTVNFAGGRMLLTGASSDRGLDLMNGLTLNVSADSRLDCDTTNTGDAKYVYIRNGTPSFVFSNNAKLVNNVVYVGNSTSTGGIKLSGEGTFVQNGFGDEALTYKGTTEIGGGVTLELNTEHQNAGNYTVASGARLTGTGSITGNGTVNLSASGAKLCGSLAIKNLSCADGAKLGDQWNPVSATITGSLAANNGAAVSVTNGCLTIGENCDVTGFATGKLDIQNAELKLGTSLSVAGLTVNNSTLTIGNGAQLNITGSTSIDCTKLKIVLDNPDQAGGPLLFAAGGFANLDKLEVSPAGYKVVFGSTITEVRYEYDPDYVLYQKRLPVVDVLVAFDQGAQKYMGERSLETFAQTQIDKMNEVLATNRLDEHYRYRLAGIAKVAETYTNIDTAPAMVAEGDGAAVTLRAMRELYGADTVTLLVKTSGATLGNSSPLTSSTDVAGCHDDAFSVCSIVAVDTGTQHTMIHENAHNMGCGHSRNQAQNPGPSAFSYGSGYYFMDGTTKRHTIMAYDVDGTSVYAYPSPYFSTSSDEFGFTLGDADNDNARVLRETCGKVSQWREVVKHYEDEVSATDEDDNEIQSGRVFSDSLTVTFTAPIDGAKLYITYDGSEPVKGAEKTWEQDSPYTVTYNGDRNVKVAYLVDHIMSPARTIRFYKRDIIPSDGLWQTSVKYPWTVEGETIRSYNQTNYTYQCTTPLKATIVGPKVLKFKHKSYFGGENVADSNYSHFDVLLDDSPVLTQTECTNSWTDAFVVIPDGTHEVTFVFSQRFAMNNSGDYKDGTPEADDAVWLKDIALIDLPHSSTSDEVAWTFPVDATRVPESYVDGLIIGNAGIVNTLEFDGTNAVVASVLAELPDGVRGEIAGCAVYRPPNFNDGNKTFYAFAYSNGDGTFSLGHGTTTDYVTSTADKVSNWTGLHVWTFAFAAQTGARLYCDGVEIASTGGIKWSDTVITNIVTFCDDPRGDWALTGAKVYAVHSDFGSEAFSNATNTPASNASVIFEQFKDLSDYANQSMETKLALLRIYKDTGSVIGKAASECVLRISEIMPKPTDALNRGALEGMDVNGLESGWVEVENTSDQWADLADYRFIRVNRGKKTDPAGVGNFPSRLVPPRGRAIFYTSERYSNSKDKAVSAFAEGTFDGKPMIFEDYGNILVWGDKVNPKKSPYVRLYYAPGGDSDKGTVVDTVVVPSDLPEGWSIIVGDAAEGEGTRRWLCPTPTRGSANTKTDGLTRIGPNVGPLYEKKGQKKTDLANEFAVPVPPATPGEDYVVTLPVNGVMNPDGAFTPRDADKITSVKLVYRKDLDDTTLTTGDNIVATKTTVENWGDQYTATIPSSFFPERGRLIQWKVLITDGEGEEWTSPSFNNPDDGYEWYGTIVEPDSSQMSATLPTWHMFADSESLEQMDVDASDQTLANNARVAIYDSSTSNYYDYVRIDLRGNTSAKFTKKSHGLRFAKAHPLTMTDVVTGEQIEEIRKTSLISEFADPSYMRQMIAFWLWRKMGNLVPFDFPVRCNLNGEFYQLAFNSERFTDELIEDVYGLDKFGYGYKNVGTLKSGSGTTAGGIEKKTPDDEDESNITVLQNELRAKITAAQDVSSSPDGGDKGLNNADLTKFVVQKFNLPAWLNYLASARITQEMDDVWANVCAYYDNADMKEGVRGTDTWMPLGYDFNLSFGQWYYGDIGGTRSGLMSNQDWYKSHPFYGGNRVRCWKQAGMSTTCNYGNDGFEAVWQSSKFRRLYLRRLRTLMDQDLKEPGTAETDTPFMAKMREMADLMRDDAASDKTKWGNDSSDNAIDVWSTRPADMDAGVDDIWENYVVPRRQHLYVTHSATNTTKTVGYGSNLNAGIPEAQSPISALAPNISISNLTALDAAEAEALGVAGQLYDTDVVVIRNDNAEVVDMSGWRLTFSVDFTFPAGTVCDANDNLYIVADRRAYIDAHDAELTDQVIVGNAKFTGAGPVALYDADGTLVYSAIPQTNELKYLRLHSFYGNTLDGGDTGEWFVLTNIFDSVTLDLAGVTVCFLRQGDPEEGTEHCHVTLENKKGKGNINPHKSWRADQADYADKGWTKIQNNKQQITIYDKYGSVCQSLKVTQKSFDLAYGEGGYLVCDSTASEVKKDSDWHQELAELPNNGAESVHFKADDIAAASNILANASVALTQEDIDAGLEAQYLTVVPKPVEGEVGKYKAVVEVNPKTVPVPTLAEPTPEDDKPVEIKENEDGSKTVKVAISNAIIGLWYGYVVADELGGIDSFVIDAPSFDRATNTTHKVTASPREKTKTSSFFHIKVLPAQPSQP